MAEIYTYAYWGVAGAASLVAAWHYYRNGDWRNVRFCLLLAMACAVGLGTVLIGGVPEPIEYAP
ncbi:hypothetical protein ABIA19_002651 [Sinorhizobium fredii]